jgi:hypothetical protein
MSRHAILRIVRISALTAFAVLGGYLSCAEHVAAENGGWEYDGYYYTVFAGGHTSGDFTDPYDGTIFANSWTNAAENWGGNFYYDPYEAFVDSNGYNNSGGWHLIDHERDTCGNGAVADHSCIQGYTHTLRTDMWQTTGGSASYYVATRHIVYYNVLDPLTGGFTSSDGSHSTYNCWSTAGC